MLIQIVMAWVINSYENRGDDIINSIKMYFISMNDVDYVNQIIGVGNLLAGSRSNLSTRLYDEALGVIERRDLGDLNEVGSLYGMIPGMRSVDETRGQELCRHAESRLRRANSNDFNTLIALPELWSAAAACHLEPLLPESSLFNE